MVLLVRLLLFLASWILMPLLGFLLFYRLTSSFLLARAGWCFRIALFAFTCLIAVPGFVILVRAAASFVQNSTGFIIAYAFESCAFSFSSGAMAGIALSFLVSVLKSSED
jgi:hypothetical protein